MIVVFEQSYSTFVLTAEHQEANAAALELNKVQMWLIQD